MHPINPLYEYAASLSNLRVANAVYDRLPGAEIDLSILSYPLHDARWGIRHHDYRWTREQSFACVATFGTGHADLNPIDLRDVVVFRQAIRYMLRCCSLLIPIRDRNLIIFVVWLAMLGSLVSPFLFRPKIR